MKPPCRIIVASSDLHFRNELSKSCADRGLTVVGQCADYAMLRWQIRKLDADVAVVERVLPGFHPVSQLAGLHERIPTLILDSKYDPEVEELAAQLSSGYVLDTDDMSEFLDTVLRLKAREDPYRPPRPRHTAVFPGPLEANILFGRYEPLSRLGGNMGLVYLARDLNTNQKVAIKVPPLDFTKDHLHRLRRESDALAKISHRNVVRLVDCSHTGTDHYVVTEFVDGLDLRKRLKGGPFPLAEAVVVAAQAADGLEATHRAGFLHRDVKPGNMVITPNGDLKIIDYGAATLAVPPKIGQDDDTLFKTIAGGVVGTPGYFSPEQFEGHQLDQRSDIYTLAIVVYEMVEGRRPMRPEVGRPTSRPEKLANAWGVIEKALANDPAERWSSMAEFAAALRAVKEESNA